MDWMAVEDLLKDEPCHLEIHWNRDRGYQCTIYLYTMIDTFVAPVITYAKSPERAVAMAVVAAKSALIEYRRIQDGHENNDPNTWS